MRKMQKDKMKCICIFTNIFIFTNIEDEREIDETLSVNMAIIGSDSTRVLHNKKKHYLRSINMKNKKIIKVALGDITGEGSLNFIMDTIWRGQEGEPKNYSSIVRIHFKRNSFNSLQNWLMIRLAYLYVVIYGN
jgi:hypothetical protein